MSSQGPKVIGTVSFNAKDVSTLNILPSSSAVSVDYVFDKDSIRDASEWIKYKKQLLVFNENKTKSFQDPFFVHGNNYRLDYLNGRFKQPTVNSCNECAGGGAFSGNGPFNN